MSEGSERMGINVGTSGLWHSAVASQPCPSGHITADKKEIRDFPKLPSVTSDKLKPLGESLNYLNKQSPKFLAAR